MKRKSEIVLMAASVLVGCLMGSARAASAGVGHSSVVVKATYHDVSPPLREMAAGEGSVPEAALSGNQSASGATTPNSATSNPKLSFPDPVFQSTAGPVVGATLGLSFAGIAASTGNMPAFPNANIAVGATQVVEFVEYEYQVFDKTTGASVLGPAGIYTIWKGFPQPCGVHLGLDVSVKYDQMAGVWVLSGRAQVPEDIECVAVSTSSDATGSYYRYSFTFSSTNSGSHTAMGVWPDAYYYASNTKSTTGGAGLACALDRANMLIGAAATAQCFSTSSSKYEYLLPSDLDGATLPPSGSPNYFLNLGGTALNLWQFHVDFQTPTNSTFTGPTAIKVASFQKACSGNGGICIPQLGTTQTLTALTTGLMYRFAYRNYGTYESLVVSHSVNPPTEAYSGIRWYEIRSPGTTPVIYQEATYSPDANSRWASSMAEDKVGDIALGYSVSSSTMYPSISYTGRVPTDLLGTLETEDSILTGTGAQLPQNTQWGNYTTLAIDPSDDCTFWYTNEYYATSGSDWSTWIASFKFASCQ